MAEIKLDLTLEYPISIDGILSLSFNQDHFKMIFQFILEALRRHESNFKTLKEQVSKDAGLLNDFEFLKKSVKEAQTAISGLQTVCHTQENTLSNHTTSIESLKDDKVENNKKFESLEKMIEKHENLIRDIKQENYKIGELCETNNKDIKGHTDEINLLKKIISQANNSNSGGVPYEALENIENKLKAVDSKHTSNYENLNSRFSDAILKKLREKIEKNSEEISELKKLLQEFDEKLKTKVNLSDFERYKALRPTGESSGSNQFLNLLEDFQKEIESLKKEVEVLNKKTSEIPVLSKNLESLTKRVVDLEEQMKHKINSSELSLLLNNTKQSDSPKDSNIPYILKRLSEIEQRLDLLSKSFNPKDSSNTDI